MDVAIGRLVVIDASTLVPVKEGTMLVNVRVDPANSRVAPPTVADTDTDASMVDFVH